IERLALLEGTGPFDNPFETAPIRMRRWIEDVRRARTASARPVGTHEDVLARLVQNHSGVKPEVLARRVPELARVGEDGVLSWLADPLHRTLSPMPFYVEAYKAFARRVACPVLSVDGGPSGFQPPDESDRLACFASVRRETLAGAGHMLHWTEPGAVSALLVDFLGPARDVRV
ncbi:MAG TPA: alpha/beta hydrolase, partial [Polyangiaceae bacterium]|nr:alpha/beta hydrolase [Polyangiaceae bacterium]